VLYPEEVRRALARRFQNQHREWLDGVGAWPLVIALGIPTEDEATNHQTLVRSWAEAWNGWTGLPGQLVWEPRQWRRLGTQRLPSHLRLFSAQEVAEWTGEGQRWRRAILRRTALAERWTPLSSPGILSRQFRVLADYSDVEFERLVRLLAWLAEHPASGLYPRQLPIEGMDTKWLEARRSVVCDLMHALHGSSNDPQTDTVRREPPDFYDTCGLLRPPPRMRIRVLCPELRKSTGGLGDLEAPVGEVAALALEPRAVLVVENLETGLALPELPRTVAILKLGNAVSLLANVPWVMNTLGVYWGDIDTHGFAILDRARAIKPDMRSVLMDESTLRTYRALCSEEVTQHSANDLARLTTSEQRVYRGLKAQTWGANLRLEQERIPWPHAMDAVGCALSRETDSLN
jgi:hypothetical protein